MSSTLTINKSRVIILGGCGFIGRHLVDYLITNDLVSEIRVVDKTPPQMAWLNQRHTELFNNPLVEYCSANLVNESSCKNAFAPSEQSQQNKTTDNNNWDFVFNCAGETRLGQTDAVYYERIVKLSLNCARESSEQNVNRFIELSCGQMYSSEKKPIDEECKLEPWTPIAKQKLTVEKELKNLNKLNYTILRLPIVYGVGDIRGLTPRITIAALYKYLSDTMKLLWNDSMKLNTIHVSDAVAAMWQLAQNPKANKEIFNCVDDSNSTQGSITNIFADIYKIKVDYWGTVLSSISKLNMNEVLEEINDKHMDPWAKLCLEKGITNTPLSPYMDEERLYHRHLNLDNSKLKSIGFKFNFPQLNRKLIEEIIDDFVRGGLLPNVQ